LIRLGLLYTTNDTGLVIYDEQHYHKLALNLLHGHGFAWEPGALTSKRPPLYPVFIALVWMVTGTESLLAVRLAQIVLSLTNVFLVYQLGLQIFNRRIALCAAAGFCFYPSFIAFDMLLLTEVLFTLFLTLVALGYAVLVKTGRASVAWGTGCALGLAALTRSILWPFPIVLCPLTFFSVRGSQWRRLQITLGLFLGYAVVVGPWAVRNTQLHGTFTVVDTMGGRALFMGNYEHTSLNRAWDWSQGHVTQGLPQERPKSSAWTEGRRDKQAQKEALAYMLVHPLLTLQRAIIKFANFWGLERTIIAAWQQKRYELSGGFAMLGTFIITLAYVVLMLFASLGCFLAPPAERRIHVFFLLLIAFISGIHTIVFGHERYHLPLIPLLCLYAAAAVVIQSWRRLRENLLASAALLMVWVGLLIIWGREVFIVDASRVKALLQGFLS
jgi:4-amino-4-deoxy-L-arabinose transferase-like glycosyltransferase